MTQRTIGIIGARGYTGRELLRLVGNHDELDLAFVSSRKLAGERVADHAEITTDVTYEAIAPDDLGDYHADAWVLALPNGLAPEWVEAIEAAGHDAVILDLSSDFRFDDTDTWTYGATEWNRAAIREATRISNPGCYATGMQAVLRPMVDYFDGPPHVFGVSGYSGAGTNPSPKNDVDLLADNMIPYGMVGHTHEREVSRHIGHPIRFNPHVAQWFRGIALTITMELSRPLDIETVRAIYTSAFDNEPLLKLVGEPPLVKSIAKRHHVEVGGLTLSEDGQRLVAVATIDNLLKGAATQALQNINLALGLPELAGISPELD
jgi:N-acetyl-gamma-glutamyl-phosphate reductase common form